MLLRVILICIVYAVSSMFANGDAEALYKQGVALFKAEPARALSLFEQAGLEGHVSAMTGAGHCYENGIGAETNYNVAIEWYEKAAEQNSINACEGLARIYASCPDPNFHDGAKAVKFASAVAKKKPRDEDSLVLLAAAYARNMEFEYAEKVQSQAVRNADIKEVEEQKCWIKRYQEGSPCPPIATEVWLLNAADKGSLWAMVQLGKAHLQQGDSQGDSQARIWFERAAEKGSAQGAFTVGKLYWMGFGGKRDMETALQYFLEAEQGGVEDAVFWVGYAYCCMRRSYGDLSNAIKYFEKQESKQLDPLSNAFLKTLSYTNWRDRLLDDDAGKIYVTGCHFSRASTRTYNTALYENLTKEVPADYPRALVCYMIAAEGGYLHAPQAVLTLLREDHVGLPANPDMARVWERRMKTTGSFDPYEKSN